MPTNGDTTKLVPNIFFSVGHSPIYTHFATTLQGMVSIRVHRQQKHFTNMLEQLFDSQNCAFFFMSCGIWCFNLYSDLLAYVIFVGTMVAGVVAPRDGK